MNLGRFAAWTIAIGTVALGVLTSVFMIVAPLPKESKVDLLGTVPFVVIATVGAVMATKRPRNPVGWCFLAFAFLLVGQEFVQRYARYAYLGHHALLGAKVAAWFGVWCWVPGFELLTLVFMLFPTGRPLSPRWRVPVAVNVAVVAITPALALPMLRNPGRLLLLAPSTDQIPHAGAFSLVSNNGLQALLLVGIATLFVRWFRSRGIERQQMKWFAFGASLLVLAVAIVFMVAVVSHVDDPTATPVGGISLLAGFSAIAIATGVAVVRYRLYDIDRIVSRTLAYVLVTAVLALPYVLIAILPSALVGAHDVPAWTIAAATLVVATMFRPVRRRAQHLVDRRFNRARYDAEQTMDEFASRMRDDVDLDTLQQELEAVVGRTMQPRHLSLWLRS